MARTVFPVYLVLDVSGSTSPIVPLLNGMLGDLVYSIHSEPTLATITHLSIISFSDDASVELRLARVSDIAAPPTLVARGGTQYGPAFRLLKECIEQDVAMLKQEGQRVVRPTAFFITDGLPSDQQWEDDLSRLTYPFPLRPNIVLVGFGGDIDISAIAHIASTPEVALITRPGSSREGDVRALFELLTWALRAFTSSIKAAGGTSIPAPAAFVPPDGFIQIPQDWL